MRFAFFLLASTAALLSSFDSVSGDSKIELSTVTSTEATPALDTLNEKRALRSNDEEDNFDEDGEERVMTPTQIAKWTARAEYWAERAKSPRQIEDKLTGLKGVMNAKDKQKYQLFLAIWLKKHPGGI